MELIYWNWILRDSRWDAKGKNPIHIWRKVQYSFEKWNWRRRNPKMEFCLVGDLASHMRILNVSKKNLKFQKQGNHRRHVSDKWSMRQPRCRAWGSRKLGTRRTGSLDHPIHTLPSPLHCCTVHILKYRIISTTLYIFFLDHPIHTLPRLLHYYTL